jgi:predicted TIM-barrel fold metal-dependent hydrolase
VSSTIDQASAIKDRTTLQLIDCDVHPIFSTEWTTELGDYFPVEYQYKLGAGSRYGGTDGNGRSGVGYSLPFNGFYPLPGSNPIRPDFLEEDGRMPAVDPGHSARQLLDRYAIDRGILLPQSGLTLGAFPDAEIASVIASAINDWQADVWLDRDSRWRGSIVVASQDPERAAEEIRRRASDSRYVGVLMPLIYMQMGHRFYYPIYEAAAHFRLPIIFHVDATSGIYVSAPSFPGGPPSYMLDFRVGFTMAHQMGLANAIANGVFERYPALKFVFTEAGFAWVPEIMWRMDSYWRTAREDTPWLKRPPSEYIIDHCRFTTQPFIEPEKHAHTEAILDIICAEKTLLFSSDYPHWDLDDPTHIATLLPDAIKQRVLVENALETYGPGLA